MPLIPLTTRKTPEIAATKMNSASSFSGSYHASCTSDAGEDTYLKRTRILHCLRVGIAVTLLVVAVAVIGCEAVPLQHYRKTSPMSHAWLTLWPVNFDLRPTTALLACGCVIAFQVSIYLSAALIPSVSSFSHDNKMGMR